MPDQSAVLFFRAKSVSAMDLAGYGCGGDVSVHFGSSCCYPLSLIQVESDVNRFAVMTYVGPLREGTVMTKCTTVFKLFFAFSDLFLTQPCFGELF